MTRIQMIAAVSLSLGLALATATPLSAQTLTVTIDHSTRLAVAGSAASVVVGNPQVADVTVVDSHTVFVSGRSYGETDVVVLDAAGRTLFSGDVLVGAGGGGGRVSVYRGAARTDMACAPGCAVSFRSETKGGSSGSAGGAVAAAAPAAPGGGLAGMLGGAMGAAASGVTHAMGGPTPTPQ